MDKIRRFISQRSAITGPGPDHTLEEKLADRLGHFTADEQRCMYLRSVVSALPSTKTNESIVGFFKNMFKTRQVSNYRKAAYDIIMDSGGSTSIPGLKYMKGIVPQLYRLKKDFAQKYPASSVLVVRNLDHQEALDTLHDTQGLLAQAQASVKELTQSKKGHTKEVRRIVDTFKDPEGALSTKMKQVVWYEKIQTNVMNINSSEDVTPNSTFQSLVTIIPEAESSLKSFYRSLYKLDELVKMSNLIKNILDTENTWFSKVKVAFVRYLPLIEKFDRIQDKIKESLLKEKDIIYTAMQAKITQLLHDIQANSDLARYQELLDTLQDEEEELAQLLVNVLSYQNVISQLQLKLGLLSGDAMKTFIVSKQEIYEMELDMIQSKQNEQWAESLQKEECPSTATAEQKLLIKSKNSILFFHRFFKVELARKEEQISHLKKIYQLEKQVDDVIGKLFASVFVLKNGLSCFASSALSYYFFTMFKTNFVIDETQFMKAFLTGLPQAQARSFMILNYAIFTSEDYVDKVLREHKPRLAEGLSKSSHVDMVTQFSVKNSFVVTLYKNYVSAANREYSDNVVNGSIGSMVFHVLFYLRERYKEEIEEGLSVSMLVNTLTTLILEMIPFIDEIIYFQLAVETILGCVFKKLEVLIARFFKFGKSKMKMVIQKVGRRIMSSDFRDYVFDLDFEQVVREQRLRQPQPGMEVRFRKIEDLYSKYFEENSVLVQAERINLFDPDKFLAEDSSSLLLDQFEEVDRFDPSDVQEDDIFD